MTTQDQSGEPQTQDQCKHCHAPIHYAEGAWLDSTKGEGCTDDSGNEQVHEPTQDQTKAGTGATDRTKQMSGMPRKEISEILLDLIDSLRDAMRVIGYTKAEINREPAIVEARHFLKGMAEQKITERMIS